MLEGYRGPRAVMGDTGALDTLLPDALSMAGPTPPMPGRAVASDSEEAVLLVVLVRDRGALNREDEGRIVPLAVGEGSMSDPSGVLDALGVEMAVLARSADRMCL